jgi:hypothetical protein
MTQSLQNHTHSPLIGLIFEENGEEVVHYFTEEKATDAAVTRNATQKALGVISECASDPGILPRVWWQADRTASGLGLRHRPATLAPAQGHPVPGGGLPLYRLGPPGAWGTPRPGS